MGSTTSQRVYIPTCGIFFFFFFIFLFFSFFLFTQQKMQDRLVNSFHAQCENAGVKIVWLQIEVVSPLLGVLLNELRKLGVKIRGKLFSYPVRVLTEINRVGLGTRLGENPIAGGKY